MKPAESKRLELYRSRIIREFFPSRGFGKASFRACRKAVSDFRKTNPSPESMGDLMLTVPEQACLYTAEYGDLDDAFYTAAVNNYVAALQHLREYQLLEQFQDRILKMIDTASVCGYGFPDALKDFYSEYSLRS